MQRDTKEVRGKYGKLQRKETALIGFVERMNMGELIAEAREITNTKNL